MSQQVQANKSKKLDPFTIGLILLIVAVVFFMPAIGSRDSKTEEVMVEEAFQDTTAPEVTVIAPREATSITELTHDELHSILTLGSGVSEDGTTVDPAVILLQLDILLIRIDAATLELGRVKETALEMRTGLQRHVDYLQYGEQQSIEVESQTGE